MSIPIRVRLFQDQYHRLAQRVAKTGTSIPIEIRASLDRDALLFPDEPSVGLCSDRACAQPDSTITGDRLEGGAE
jgi:hypothetical protein